MHGGSALASLAQHRAKAIPCSMSSGVLSSPVPLLARKQGLGSVEVRQRSCRSCRDCRGAAGAALPYAGYLRFYETAFFSKAGNIQQTAVYFFIIIIFIRGGS